MSESEIPAEVREAYRRAFFNGHVGLITSNVLTLAIALRDERARANRAEWGASHRCEMNPDWGENPWYTHCADPRHNWTLEQWQAAAHKEYMGE